MTPCARYLARGWSVIPLAPREKFPDPALLPKQWDAWEGREKATWKPYQERHATMEEVAAWLARSPDLNLGILTGAVSGLVVLDLDGAAAVRDALTRGLPHTPIATTGKGLHLYLAHPGGAVPNRANLIEDSPGYDLRGDGGYVVAPPSVHPSGWQYRWLVTPEEIPLAPLPEWLQEALVCAPKCKECGEEKRTIGATVAVAQLNEVAAARLAAYVERAVEEELAALRQTQDGARNHQLNRAAFCLGQFVGLGLLERTAVEQALGAAATQIGLSRREARRTIASGLRAGTASPRALPDFTA